MSWIVMKYWYYTAMAQVDGVERAIWGVLENNENFFPVDTAYNYVLNSFPNFSKGKDVLTIQYWNEISEESYNNMVQIMNLSKE